MGKKVSHILFTRDCVEDELFSTSLHIK